MTSEIEPQIIKLGQQNILCDAAIAAELKEGLFSPDELKAQGLLTGKALGRGEAWFIKYRDHNWVLRHFRRGGLVGRFVTDRYVGLTLEGSRSWTEWRLLAELCRRGLPVPRPVAASVRRGCCSYRADLLTELISDANSLAERLMVQSQPEEFWRAIGTCIRRFHDQGVYHADLNANNILIDGRSQIYLIDFDRGEIRPSGNWTEQNLKRLKRSLIKIKGNSTSFYFNAEDWNQLLLGYETTC